jgi:pimeloyl-ACP methyl ester carboxylesterase
VSAQRKSVIAAGHRLSYQEAGPADGPVVVLIHGLASDSDTWDRAIEPLAARGLRVLALDLLGHGRSDRPAGRYLLDDFAVSLEGFFQALASSELRWAATLSVARSPCTSAITIPSGSSA